MTEKSTMGPTMISTLAIMEGPDGEQWTNAVMERTDCGCKIVGGGTCQQPLKIEFCPLHAAVKGGGA